MARHRMRSSSPLPTGPQAFFDPAQLPGVRDEQGQVAVGVFLMLFASLWGGLPGLFLIKAIVDGKFHLPMLGMALFPLIGLALFVFGLSQFFFRRQTRVALDEVAQRQKGLFGRRQWQEPLANYQGVMLDTETRSRNKSTYTVHVVRLQHAEKQRCVLLWEAYQDAGHRQVWEQWARALHLPALTKDAQGGVQARALEDLDKSVRDLVAEGRVKVKFDPRQRPPPPLTVERLGEGWELGYRAGAGGAGGAVALLVFLAIGGGLCYVALATKAPDALAVVGGFFVVIAVVAAWLVKSTRYRLTLTPGRVGAAAILPWGEMQAREFAAAEVEEVRLAQADRTRRPCVRIVTDGGQIEWGEGLDEAARQWVCDCVTWHVAQREPGAVEE